MYFPFKFSDNSGSGLQFGSSESLSDLNFDPAEVIDGEGQGQEGLNVSLCPL